MTDSPRDVLDFWFDDTNRAFWFERNAAFDQAIIERFVPMLKRAASGKLDTWRQGKDGALALVLLLDQFPRNAFRGSPESFAYDPQARDVAGAAIDAGFDQDMSVEQRLFLYLPFEHSENIGDQARSMELMASLEDENYLDYARRHQVIIERFGRFPHRNQILGRTSTEEELLFLEQPDSSF